MKRVFFFLFVSSLLLSGGSWAEDASVRAFHDEFFAAWNAGNADGLVSRLTEDTVYHPMGAETLRGREVGESYRTFLQDFDVRMAVQPELLEAHGNRGVMQGTYTSTMTPRDGQPTTQRSGRYYMTLVRGNDGQWHIAHEITQPTADPVPEPIASDGD